VYYDPQHVADGQTDLGLLSDDTKCADIYSDNNIDEFRSDDAGVLYSYFLSRHADSVAKNHVLVGSARTLLGNARTHLGGAIQRYAETNNDARTHIAGIFKELDATDSTPPLGPTPGGHGTRGDLPSSLLRPPESEIIDPVLFSILNWPEYLSASSWIRKFMNGVINWVEPGTGDIFENLYARLGGRWDEINLVADSWRNIEHYFWGTSDELRARMQIMFEGWGGSDALGAQEAGEYFSDACGLFLRVSGVYAQLGRQYGDIADASFGLFQTLWTSLDAFSDALVAAFLAVDSVIEFLSVVLAVPAVVQAALAVVEAVGAIWASIVYMIEEIVTVVSLLDAMSVDVQFKTLPEG
jgi:hypothetical protein